MALLSVLLALVGAASGWQCYSYVCDPPDMEWADWICGLPKPFNASEYAIKSDACAEGMACVVSNFNYYSSCEAETVQKIALPGEPCGGVNQCMYTQCAAGVCTSLPPGSACSNVWDCEPGYTCSHKKCTPLKKVGEKCSVDTDCVQNAGCNRGQYWWNTGICVEYLSLPPHVSVKNCESSEYLGKNPLCASGMCGVDSEGQGFCADFVESTTALPVAADYGMQMCFSSADSLTGQQGFALSFCGYASSVYCDIFPGDAPMKAYLDDVRQYLNSTAVAECNTYSRGTMPTYLGNWCAEATFNPTPQMVVDYYLANNYQQLVNADDCVLKTLQPQYYSALLQVRANK